MPCSECGVATGWFINPALSPDASAMCGPCFTRCFPPTGIRQDASPSGGATPAPPAIIPAWLEAIEIPRDNTQEKCHDHCRLIH